MPFITAQKLPLGSSCPGFGAAMDLGTTAIPAIDDPSRAGRPLCVMFLCNHCPKTVPFRTAISVLAEDFGEKVDFVAVMSNDVLYCPMDGVEEMAKEKAEFGWKFPYLFDEDQSVAKAFKASLTPEFFLYAPSSGIAAEVSLPWLCWHGACGTDGLQLKNAIESLLSTGETPPGAAQAELATGCDLKWTMPGEPPLRKPDAAPNAPDYWTSPDAAGKAGEDSFHQNWNEKFAAGEWKSFPVQPPP